MGNCSTKKLTDTEELGIFSPWYAHSSFFNATNWKPDLLVQTSGADVWDLFKIRSILDKANFFVDLSLTWPSLLKFVEVEIRRNVNISGF